MSKQDKCDSTKFYNPIWIFLEQDLTQFSRFTKNIIVRFEFKMSLTAHFLQSEWLSLMKAPFMSKVYPPRSVVLLCRQNNWQKVLLETFYQQKFHYYCLCCRYFDHWLLKNSKYNWRDSRHPPGCPSLLLSWFTKDQLIPLIFWSVCPLTGGRKSMGCGRKSWCIMSKCNLSVR